VEASNERIVSFAMGDRAEVAQRQLQRRHWQLLYSETSDGTQRRGKQPPGLRPRQWRPLRAMLGRGWNGRRTGHTRAVGTTGTRGAGEFFSTIAINV